MAGLMAITIAGNIGAEPEYKQDGNSRLSFRVAVNTWDRERGEQTTWFGVTVWGKYADSLYQSGKLRRGGPVVVSGQLTPREYTDRTGTKQTSLDIRPDSVQSFAPKEEAAQLPFGEAPF